MHMRLSSLEYRIFVHLYLYSVRFAYKLLSEVGEIMGYRPSQ